MQQRRTRACQTLEHTHTDFQAKLFAAQDLFFIARDNPGAIDARSLSALRRTLVSPQFASQRQRLFLYRETAQVLGAVIESCPMSEGAIKAYNVLRDVLAGCRDQSLRAAAESLGRLPAHVAASDPPPISSPGCPIISWSKLLAAAGFDHQPRMQTQGRTLILCGRDPRRLVAVKFGRCKKDRRNLAVEAAWMQRLTDHPLGVPVRFEIPRPLTIGSNLVFRLKDPPPGLCGVGCGAELPAVIAFHVSVDYFAYPNPFDPEQLPAAEAFSEVMARSAYLLGALAAKGIGHEAPIPLFHNRVQRERRRDLGRYEWYRSGRLDRWLASCAYPNFGFSGIRDFEHLVGIGANAGDLGMYRLIGQHFLSLLLVLGSYFRAKDPQRVGMDKDGQPVDARDLFDANLLTSWLETVYRSYYHGFVGRTTDADLPVDKTRLANRMIEEMGMDRYMEEILRAADQQQMSQPEFERFLSERGYDAAAIGRLCKGRSDLVIHTGPHLGAFNRPISLPELIEAVSAMAGACVSGRFFHRRYS